MKARSHLRAGILVCATALMITSCRTAPPLPGAATTPQAPLPEEVHTHIQAMAQALTSAKALRFTAQGYMDESLPSGQLVQIGRRSRVVVKRPDRMHLDTEGDDVNWELWYDGKALTILDRSVWEAASAEAPPTLDELLDAAVSKHGLTIPLSDLLYSDIKGPLLQNVQAARYLGLQTIEDHACHHMAFRQEVVDWQLWVDAATPPVPRKLVITYKLEPGHPQYVSVMRDWDLDPKLPDVSFTEDVPKGARMLTVNEFFGRDGEEEVQNDNL
jgi:hypothetical protein